MLAAPMRREGTGGRKWSHQLVTLALSLAGISSWSFGATFTEEFEPWKAVEGRDGRFYGTMVRGVPGGSVYSLTPRGRLERVRNFSTFRYSPKLNRGGFTPKGGVGIGQDGSVYSVTLNGGVFGAGTLFKIDPKGKYTTLHHFEGVYSSVVGPLLVAENGDILVRVSGYPGERLVRLSKDGSCVTIPLNETVTALTETTNHEIVAATSGRLRQLNASNQFETLADLEYSPQLLVPLEDGGLLCAAGPDIFKVSMEGQVSAISRPPPHNIFLPNFLMVSKDGSYFGSMSIGGHMHFGSLFRIDSQSNVFTPIGYLPPQGWKDAGKHWLEHVFPHRVTERPDNLPPMAKDDVIQSATLTTNAGSFPQTTVAVLNNDSDADKDLITIVSASNPQHGTAVVDSVSQTITYTSNSAEVKNDSFTYTIADAKGGQAAGHVLLRTDSAGHYTGDVNSPGNTITGAPGIKVGALELNIDSKRKLVGRVTLLERNYRFVGRLNEMNRLGVVLSAGIGRPNIGMQLWLRPNETDWTIEAHIENYLKSYSATCTTKEK
jgi:uncharacterized repeat protein (TIGR03803 family)